MEASNGVAVVMVPLPSQGHLNQLLHLTRIISRRGLPVHFTGSATHNCQAKDRVHGWDPSTISNIHFHDFEFPQVISPPANPNTRNILPSLTMPTYKACVNLRKPLGLLLRKLASVNRRVVVVYDSFMAFAAHEASFVSNAEAYCFVPSSAFGVLHIIWEALGQPADEEKNILPKDVPRVAFGECFGEGFSELLELNTQYMNLRAGDIYNTCEAIEGKFIHLLAQFQKDKSLWSVGPFNPIQFAPNNGSFRHRSLEWLDKQDPSSVVYVSFGTATSLSDDEIAELANGLERSGQRFIWALRDADLDKIYNEEGRRIQLPNGFEERVKGVGLVVRDWAPQLQILAHKSTGGFLSHCGWNSILESLSMGVPIAAWPMHSDQPRVALLVTEILKVGLIVREWSRREELILSDEIACSLSKLMVSDEGNMMRTRVKELGFEVRRAVSEGGSSTNQLESFLAHISR